MLPERWVGGARPRPCRLFLCGERPGREELAAGIGFVGPAGQELWTRMEFLGLPAREHWYVTNLVKTFSMNPPSATDIAEWGPRLRQELTLVQPEVIVTVGYHAARFFLPQFEGVKGDYFHGLGFGISYGRLHPRAAVVVPVVHSAAALRQPDRYQQQLTNDLQAVARALDQGPTGDSRLHATTRLTPYAVGLAAFGRPHEAIGCDTEGTRTETQAVTLARSRKDAFLAETFAQPLPKFARAALTQAKTVYLHNAVHDLQALDRLGVDTTRLTIDDPMLMAYLLGLPQSLKILMYREFGIEMSDYSDLVEPLDETNVRTTLQAELDRLVRRLRLLARYRGRPSAALQARRRCRTSLTKLLGTPAADSLRARWAKSVFSARVSLPRPPSWKDVPTEIRQPYALTDAIGHWLVGEALSARIAAQGLTKAYRIDRDVLPFLARNEQIGLACDKAQLEALSVRFAQEFAEVSAKINAMAGYSVNPLSGEQVSDCLFRDLRVKPTRRTKSGKHFTTEDKYLKARRNEHAIVPLIIEARQIDKMRGTYTDRLPAMLVEDADLGWRYHPDWRYTRTATGRLAEPIIVLIPKHSLRGLQIRACFYARPGHTLVLCDLSQIEMRVMAHLSGDAVLLARYQRGEDVHAGTAHDLLGAPKRKEDQDESLHRLPAKTMNFGIINGMTEYGMLDQLHEAGQFQWTLETVREFRAEWFKLHQGVETFWHNQIGYGRRKGYVQDLFGARRMVPGLQSADSRIVAEAERQCLAPIQATADRISKIWNRRIWHKILLKARGTFYCEPWVRVHDETALEVDERYAQRIEAQMLELIPDLLCLPTTGEGLIESRWGGTKLAKLHKKSAA